LGTPPPLHHSAIQLHFSSGGAILNTQDLRQASFFINSGVFQRPPYDKMAVGFVVPEVRLSSHPLYLLPASLFICDLPYRIFSFSFFLCIFIPQNTRSYPTKLSFLPINHIFNASAL